MTENKAFDEAIMQAEIAREQGLQYMIILPVRDWGYEEPLPPEPVEPPPEPLSVQVQITDDKALAHFISGYNNRPDDKGGPAPIMMIYPSEVSPAAERVRYDKGDRVDVDPDMFEADEVDGSDGFWLIDDLAYTGQGDLVEIDLFLQESKVAKV